MGPLPLGQPETYNVASLTNDIDEILFTPDCARLVMSGINTRHGLVALFWNWLQIALRSRNCGIMAEVMQLAYSYHFSLDDFNVVATASLLSSITEDMMMPGVRQWYESDQVCIVRGQMDGLVAFFPNKAFVEKIGSLKDLEMRVPNGGQRPVSPLCAAEVLLSFIVGPSHRMCFLWILSSMWSHVDFSDVVSPNKQAGAAGDYIPRNSKGSNDIIEMSFNDIVEVELARKDDGTEPAYAPCKLRGRIQKRSDQRAVWMCLEFVQVEVRPAPLPQIPLGGVSQTMPPTGAGGPSS